MHDKPRGAGDDNRAATTTLELRDQGVVLTYVLAVFPIALAVGELLRDLCVSAGDFAERDRYERAVRELIGAGLLRGAADFLLPTLAALRFDQIVAVGV
jgi:hypothetical protein